MPIKLCKPHTYFNNHTLTFPFELRLGAARILRLFGGPGRQKTSKQETGKSGTDGDLCGLRSEARLFWHPLTLRQLRPPVKPERWGPGQSHTAHPPILWESRCPAGSPPAGSGCRDRRAKSPKGLNLTEEKETSRPQAAQSNTRMGVYRHGSPFIAYTGNI